MRRAAQLLKDIEATRRQMEREPRRRAENRRANAREAAQEVAPTQDTVTPPSATVAMSELTSYKRAMAGKEHVAWATAT